MRQEPRLALRTIKMRVRVNAFTYSGHAFEAMVDQSLDEEDVKRAVASAHLLETRESDQLGTCYVLQGFAMSEEEILVVCRLRRRMVEVLDLSWV